MLALLSDGRQEYDNDILSTVYFNDYLFISYIYLLSGISAPSEMSTLSRNCQEQTISVGMIVRERNSSHII